MWCLAEVLGSLLGPSDGATAMDDFSVPGFDASDKGPATELLASVSCFGESDGDLATKLAASVSCFGESDGDLATKFAASVSCFGESDGDPSVGDLVSIRLCLAFGCREAKERSEKSCAIRTGMISFLDCRDGEKENLAFVLGGGGGEGEVLAGEFRLLVGADMDVRDFAGFLAPGRSGELLLRGTSKPDKCPDKEDVLCNELLFDFVSVHVVLHFNGFDSVVTGVGGKVWNAVWLVAGIDDSMFFCFSPSGRRSSHTEGSSVKLIALHTSSGSEEPLRRFNGVSFRVRGVPVLLFSCDGGHDVGGVFLNDWDDLLDAEGPAVGAGGVVFGVVGVVLDDGGVVLDARGVVSCA